MNLSKISVRYAKAIFEFAVEKKCVDAVKADMEMLLNTCNTNKEFNKLLSNPTLTVSEKKTFFKTLLKSKVAAETLQFIDIVIDNKRELYLDGIARNFLDKYRVSKKIKAVTIKSAAPMSDGYKKKLVDFVESKYSVTAELTEELEKELIGGFVLRIEDEQYDLSVANKLNKLKQGLLQAKI